MRRFSKLLFVCTENTARSQMAEVICKNMVADDTIEINSRGLVVLFPEPVNPKAEVVLINHGIFIEGHQAKQLIQEDMDEETLVFTMSREQKERISRDYNVNTNIYTIKEFNEEEGDVMDPYGGTLVEYEECFVELSRDIKKIVLRLRKIYGLRE